MRFRRHAVSDEERSAYVDAALSPERRRRVDEHIASCDECVRRIDELNSLKSMLAELPPAKAPRSFALTPEQVVRPVAPSPAPYAKRLSWGFSGAAMAAALFLAMFLSFDVFVVDGNGSGSTAVMTADGQSTKSMPSPSLMDGAGAAGPLPESREADKDASIADATSEMLGALDSGAAASPQEARPDAEDNDPVWLWALEGAAGGLAVAFGALALYVRLRRGSR